MFNLPIFFVLEAMIFEQGLNSLIEKEIPYNKLSKEGYIIKINTSEQLEVFCNLSEEVTPIGLECLYFTD